MCLFGVFNSKKSLLKKVLKEDIQTEIFCRVKLNEEVFLCFPHPLPPSFQLLPSKVGTGMTGVLFGKTNLVAILSTNLKRAPSFYKKRQPGF